MTRSIKEMALVDPVLLLPIPVKMFEGFTISELCFVSSTLIKSRNLVTSCHVRGYLFSDGTPAFHRHDSNLSSWIRDVQP